MAEETEPTKTDETDFNTAAEERLPNESYDSQQGFSEPEIKESFLSFLKSIIGLEDSTKTSNLTSEEMNNVRIYQNMAHFSKQFKLENLNNYLFHKGEIILATSLSRKGFLLQTAITSVRKVDRNDNKNTGAAKEQSGWFKNKFDNKRTTDGE